ncbi:MAG: DUF1579 family protein [bacterium]
MRKIWFRGRFLVWLLAAVVPGLVQAQVSEQEPGKQAGADDMKAAIAEYMKYSQPGKYHDYLKPLAGKWQLTGKVRMAENAPWQEIHSESEIEWILGGRFLTEKIQGKPSDWMPQAFEGFHILGYDNYKQKYLSFWMDNFNTMVVFAEGLSDASGKMITFTGSYDDPMSGSQKEIKRVYDMVGNDKYIYREYDRSPAGKKYVSIEIVYMRKK